MAKRALAIELCRRRNVKPPLAIVSPINFVFIFSQINAENQTSIKKILGDEQQRYPPIGTSLDDYQLLERTIIQKARDKRHIYSKFSIILVTDIENCKKILEYKTNNSTIRNIKQVFLCYPLTQKNKEQAKKLGEQYPNINKNHRCLETVILIADKLKRIQGKSAQILKNFIYLDRKDYEQSSYIAKIRIVGCLNLASQDFEQYKQRFESSLDSGLKKSSSTQKIMKGLLVAEKLYNQNKMSQFSQEMLSLYQTQSVFYPTINKSLLSLTEKQFDWRAVALPICFMYKAIKIRFQQQKKWPQYEKLFGDKDHCYLWRACLKSDKEIQLMYQQKQKQQKKLKQKKQKIDNLYLEFKHYVSTSMSEKIALDFIDKEKFGNYCLIRYKLKRPTNQQEISRLSFIYQTFAIMKPLPKKDEQQVLLNLLSVGKFVDITDISCKDIQDKSDQLKTKFKELPNSMTIPLIDIGVGYFQDELFNYKAYLQNINQKRAEQQQKKKEMKEGRVQNEQSGQDMLLDQYPDSWVFKNYIMTIDSIKKKKNFDIGCSLKASGNLEDAYRYDNIKLKQLKKKQPSMNQQKNLQNVMQLHQICNRLASTCMDLHNEQQAAELIKKSLQHYKEVERLDERRTFRQHEEYLNKIYQQEGTILKMLGRPEQAIKKMKEAIEELNMHAIRHPEQKQLCQFLIAERQMVLGTFLFKTGNISAAQNYVEVSKMRLDKVYAEIGYEQLKKQTFFFGFILYFLKCLLTEGQMADKQQYFQSRRAENISQATFIFGGREKFNKVQSSSIQLVDEMKSFIDDNQQNLVYDGNGNLLYVQFVGEDRGQIGPDNSMPIAQKMEKQFQNHPLVDNFKEQSNQFFTDFTQKILQFQNSMEKHTGQKFKAIIKLIFQRNKILSKNEENQIKIQNLKSQIIDKRLQKWDQIDQYSQFDQSAIEMKIKIENIVLEAVQKMLFLSNDKSGKRKNRQITLQLSKNIASTMEKSLRQRQKWGFLNPTQPILKHYSIILKCYDKSQDIVNQIHNIKKMLAILEERPDLIENIIDGYLMSIKLHYKMADFDFVKQMINTIDIFKLQEIRIHQNRQLSECQSDITDALGQIKKYQGLLKIKESYSPRKRKGSSIIRKKGSHLLLNQNKILVNAKLQSFQQNVKSFSVQLSLWKIKIFLYKNEVNREKMNNNSRKICQKQFRQVQMKIKELKQHSQRFNQCFFKQMSGTFQFTILPPEMPQNQLDNKLTTIIQKMKEALYLADNINQRSRHLQILIKIFLMFSQDNYLLIEDLYDYLLQYSLTKSNPFYWKVCLVMSFIVKNQQQKAKYIEVCLEQLSKYKEKSQHFNYKYQLINSYFLSQLKKTDISLKRSKSMRIGLSKIAPSKIVFQKKQEKREIHNESKPQSQMPANKEFITNIVQQGSAVNINPGHESNQSPQSLALNKRLSLQKNSSNESTLRESPLQVGSRAQVQRHQSDPNPLPYLLQEMSADQSYLSQIKSSQLYKSKIMKKQEKQSNSRFQSEPQESNKIKQQKGSQKKSKKMSYKTFQKRQSFDGYLSKEHKSDKMPIVDYGESEKHSKAQSQIQIMKPQMTLEFFEKKIKLTNKDKIQTRIRNIVDQQLGQTARTNDKKVGNQANRHKHSISNRNLNKAIQGRSIHAAN